MLVPFSRTLILYLTVILAIRFMGKRQVGEMQPNELVITILISAVASVPMQDIDIPLVHGIVPVLTLIAAEVGISTLTIHFPKLRRLLSGKPIQSKGESFNVSETFSVHPTLQVTITQTTTYNNYRSKNTTLSHRSIQTFNHHLDFIFMPGKWQILMRLGQETMLRQQAQQSVCS